MSTAIRVIALAMTLAIIGGSVPANASGHAAAKSEKSEKSEKPEKAEKAKKPKKAADEVCQSALLSYTDRYTCKNAIAVAETKTAQKNIQAKYQDKVKVAEEALKEKAKEK